MVFGQGSRSCFGKPLALLEMKLLLLHLVHRFDLQIDPRAPRVVPEQMFGLRPKDNQVWIELREPSAMGSDATKAV